MVYIVVAFESSFQTNRCPFPPVIFHRGSSSYTGTHYTVTVKETISHVQLFLGRILGRYEACKETRLFLHVTTILGLS